MEAQILRIECSCLGVKWDVPINVFSENVVSMYLKFSLLNLTVLMKGTVS